jgi:hypothetical protein
MSVWRAETVGGGQQTHVGDVGRDCLAKFELAPRRPDFSVLSSLFPAVTPPSHPTPRPTHQRTAVLWVLTERRS